MAWGAPAPVGANVSIYMDTQRVIRSGDFVRTRTGRLYQVTAVREQQRGKHGPVYDAHAGHKVMQGRQHLRCEVMPSDMDLDVDDVVHGVHWYGPSNPAPA